MLPISETVPAKQEEEDEVEAEEVGEEDVMRSIF